MRLSPDDAWRQVARDAIAARDYRRAHQLCMVALSREPRSAEALFLLRLDLLLDNPEPLAQLFLADPLQIQVDR